MNLPVMVADGYSRWDCVAYPALFTLWSLVLPMSDAFDELFASVREAAGPRVWSKGVEIARGEAVRGESSDGETAVFTVKDDAASVARRVHLAFNDGEWECDCQSEDDPCRHVAAAVIAYRRAREQGQALPQSTQTLGKIIYRLYRHQGQLALERRIQIGDDEQDLPGSVAALAAGRIRGPRLAADQLDLSIDLALGSHRSGPIPATAVEPVCAALSALENLSLDGQAIRVAAQTIGLAVRVRDEGPGVRLSGEQDPDIKELFGNNAALTHAGELRPVRLPALAPGDQAMLRQGRFFSPRELVELAGEILPRLSRQLRVIRETNRLPDAVRTRLRPALELVADGDALKVTPRLVYGEPPVAKIVAGELQMLTGKLAAADAAPLRDLDAERQLRDAVWAELRMELDRPTLLASSAAIKFVSETLPALRQRARGPRLELVLLGDGAHKFTVFAALLPQLQMHENDFELEFVVPQRGTGLSSLTHEDGADNQSPRRASAQAVLAAYARGESLVPLLDGGFAPLPTDWLARYGERVRDLLDAKSEAGQIPRALMPTMASLLEETGAQAPQEFALLRDRLSDYRGLSTSSAPDGLDQLLRPYQKDGVRWLVSLSELGCGALLADDMGLGKTLQAICVLKPRSLIVAPTSVVPNWMREIARFRPNLRTQLYHGANRELDPRADVIVTTYAILRLDIERLSAETWQVAVLDEAQTIKNPDSQAARAAFRLKANFRLSLSGTPVENRLEDLWSQMRFANPGLLGRRSDFDERYSRPISQGDALAAANLRRRIKPFMLRRLKSEVARDLPPRTDTTLYVELSSEERAIYDAVLAAARRDVVAKLDQGATALDALEALLRLRQACCHARLLPGAPGPAVSAKLEMLVERLSIVADEGHRALVFTQWTSLLDLLEPLLKAAQISFLRLDGTTRDRDAVVTAFQAQDGPSVLIMSLKAGGVGLNLTAADHVFIVDPWWNPAAEDQAADRAHRIGQTRPVQVHRLVAQATVEERILALQDHKRALAQAATAGSAQVALSREDLLSLFEA